MAARNEAEAAEPGSRTDPSRGAAPLCVLVAEDNATGRRVLAALLEKLGHRCHAVDDGDAALAALDQIRPDIVVMNLRMPGLDGLSAIRAIRALPAPLSSLPVAAITADRSAETAQAARDAGADAVLCRPVHRPMLAAALDAALSARRAAAVSERPHVRALLALEQEIGRETVAMLLNVLVEDSAVRIAAMRASLGDAEGAAREAHALKSAFGTFGLDGAARLARDIEAAAGSLTPAMLAIAIDALEDEFAHLVGDLRDAHPTDQAA